MVRFVCMALANNWLMMACFSTIIPEHYDYHVNIDGYYTNNDSFFSFVFYLFLPLPLLSVDARSAKPPSIRRLVGLDQEVPTSPGPSTVASGSLVYILLGLLGFVCRKSQATSAQLSTPDSQHVPSVYLKS